MTYPKFKTSEEALAWANRNQGKQDKPDSKSLPGPVPEAFNDRYRNDTERAYAVYLDQLKQLHEIRDWRYEPFKIWLAPKTTITIDWLVVKDEWMELQDTKGHMRPQWWNKFKICQSMYPYFKYAIVKKEKGEWDIRYL